MDTQKTLAAEFEAVAPQHKSQEQEKRIRELELRVHTLTAAVQHMMSVIGPLLELARQAESQSRIVRP